MLLRDTSLWASGGLVLALALAPPPTKFSGQTGKKTAAPTATSRKPLLPGENIFRQQCASCHGTNGEGTKSYPRALTGSQSVAQLSDYIAHSMPPGPTHCKAPDAKKVAAYLYDAFYSPVAQERNRPARIALSRLTVGQFRNSVADVVGSFGGQASSSLEHGLRAEYYKANRFDKKDIIVNRTDAEVKFDFGTGGPSGGEFNPHQFSIRWSGNVVAPDTGVYEFNVRTEHATRLYLNGWDKPVLDAWVKSGNDINHKVPVYLIGGRSYPIRLEFSKSTQGVDDSDKKKGKPAPPASVTLLWKRPKQAEEPIPARCLTPVTSPISLVVATNFPPDDRSLGYERGNSISKEWDDATTQAALEAADYVATHLKDLAGTQDDVPKLQSFCRTFVERALRRPLDKSVDALYITRQFKVAPDPVTAVKRVVLLTLKSPRFLYQELGATANDPYDTASRLSYTLWDTLPDQALLKAAASGQLKTPEQVRAQAGRMIADPRAWHKQREFFLQWLKVDQYPDLTKDAKRYPNFSNQISSDLRTSLDLTLESVVRSERSDFRELLLTNKYYMNDRLAALYGAKLPVNAGDDFKPVALDSNVRAGILTHPYLLASFSYLGTSSPIHRGVLLTRSVMGRTLAPPPAAFAPLAADLHPNLTTRQRVAMQTKPTMCMSCHTTINSLGFALERFDAIGRVRTSENNQPIDASGSYKTRTGTTVKFTGARDLAKFVSTSDEAHAAFVEKYFQFLVKQPIRAYGKDALPNLQRGFAANEYNMRKLAVEIATASALSRKK